MVTTRLGRRIAQAVQRDGVFAAVPWLRKRLQYGLARVGHWRSPGRERWAELRGRYSGERAFLIGNGPSLNRTPLYLLKNEQTMCFNRFSLMQERLNWTPSFYMTVDDLVLEDLVGDMPGFLDTAPLFFFPDIHSRGKRFDDRIGHHDKILWLRPRFGRGFSTELPEVRMGGSVIYEGLQVLHFLGFEEIYLVGVDMNFRLHDTAAALDDKGRNIRGRLDDDPNHFDPRYFGRNRQYHQPDSGVVRGIVENLEYVARVAPRLGLDIRNAGVDSKLECFERVDLLDVLGVSPERAEALFDECVSAASTFATWRELDGISPLLGPSERGSARRHDHFATDVQAADGFIREHVFTHVPLGPFRGRYYFVRRRGETGAPAPRSTETTVIQEPTE